MAAQFSSSTHRALNTVCCVLNTARLVLCAVSAIRHHQPVTEVLVTYKISLSVSVTECCCSHSCELMFLNHI